MKRNLKIVRASFPIAAMLMAATIASANDRDLLYTKRAAPADVMIVVSNTDSMATCMPGQSLPNNQTCPSSGTLPMAPDGFSDGPNSKLGIAKAAITSIIRSYSTQFNFGLSSFAVSRQNLSNSPVKRYVFESQEDDFGGAAFDTPSGTLNNFGAPIGSTTTLTDGATTYTTLPWAANGAPTWVQSTSGTTGRQPYGGSAGTTKFILYNLETGSNVKSVNNSFDKGKEIVLYISETDYQSSETNNGPYRIHFDDEDKFKVTESLYQCGNNALTAAVKPSTCTQVNGDETIEYKVPTGYCEETDTTCTYPTIYGYGSQLREEMGWVNFKDANSSADQSGWLQQSNSNPQPVVMIAHDYSPWTPYNGYAPSGVAVSGKVQYAENSNPCILRSMRPSSSIVDNTTLTESDHFPIFTPGTGETCSSGNCQSQCDKMVDGLFQTGKFPNGGTNEVTPVVFPRGDSGGGPPLSKLLGGNGVYDYFNGGNNACSAAGGGVDGFCAGVRPDDPFKNCRQSAVILISDVLTMGSPSLSFSVNSLPNDSTLNKLKAIGVPVFVIGFALTSSGTPATNQCLLKSGSHGNTGECIAENTGATTYNGTTVLRQGYYLADTAAKLASALTAVLNSLNTTTRDFATATIPSVSATSGGIAYLSQFNPRNNRSIWEGHLRAYFLDPSTGLVQSLAGKPDPTQFTFWSGSSPASGSILWDAGNSPSGSDTTSTLGNLDGIRNVNPNLLLTDTPGAGGAWSNSNDQANSVVGRNVFFGVKPGDTGCTGGTLSYECLAQVPVGSGGNSPTPTNTTEPSTGWTVPSPPTTLPSWWSTAQGSSYVNIPSTPLEGSGNASQALQNSFSFARGNRDPVVEAFKLSSKFDATHTICSDGTGNSSTDLAKDSDSPCYYGDTMGDLFHSNPTVVASPTNFRYYFAQDPGTATAGTYADRGQSYQTFQSDHAHRRKILYAGANDGALHAFDIGVFNGDTTTYDPGTGSICPLCGRYSFGSGREIFAFLPRAGLNKIYDLAHTLSYNWTIDGPPSIDDVYIDVTRVGTSSTPQGVAPSGSGADSDLSGATPVSQSHSWRTVLVGTEREGGLDSDGSGIVSGTSGKGGSVFALDITDPDAALHMKSSWTGIASGQTPIRGVPECIKSDFNPATDSPPTSPFDSSPCTAPFPRILWEIRDDQSTTTTPPYPTETSTAATTQDLGMTWSQPVIGRVKITVGSGSRDFFVAIFGGGYDHTAATLSATNASGNTGNFLYMVDIETGRIIYKKNLGPWISGASGTSTAGNLPAGVPGTPGVIDINGDGYLDAVYIGDTQGRLWKVDLTASATLSSSNRVQDTDWNPVMFFDEYLNSTVQGTKPRQPIFTQPAAFFAGNTSSGQPKIGIAFGTGDRDNMPTLTDTNPNFLTVLVDPPSRAQAVDNDHPLTFADLTLASLTANNCNSSNCLNANGYYISLPTGSSGAQIVNTDPLIFNQQIFFNTFLHSTVAGDCNEIGVPYVYILNYLTGESVQTDSNGNVVANTSGPDGAEVLSTDIIFSSGGGANSLATNTTDSGSKINVTSSADSTAQDQVKTGGAPTVKIKSWKEQ